MKYDYDMFDSGKNRGYPTTFDKAKPLKTSPHYSDKRFEQEQTVFGKPSRSRYGHKHLSYDYSDRLWQWDYDKAEQSAKCANEGGATLNSCRWYEAYLSAYFGRAITIEQIVAGVNRSNGFPYCVFGYRDAIITKAKGEQT